LFLYLLPVARLGMVAVGTPVTWRPPHRSRRAALPHRAPASGRDAQASADAGRTPSSTCDRAHPALRPDPGMLDHVPLGQLPSLHLLRRSHGATLVRRLPRYSAAVRLPAPVHHGRAPQVHRADLAIPHQARGRASRVPHRGLRSMQRSPTPPGPFPPHLNGVDEVAFRVFGARRHPGRAAISGLNTLPARAPVTASCLPLPKATHDSGPVWLAGPSLSGTCTLLHSAGFSRRLPERCASAAPGSAG